MRRNLFWLSNRHLRLLLRCCSHCSDLPFSSSLLSPLPKLLLRSSSSFEGKHVGLLFKRPSPFVFFFPPLFIIIFLNEAIQLCLRFFFFKKKTFFWVSLGIVSKQILLVPYLQVQIKLGSMLWCVVIEARLWVPCSKKS